MKKIFTKEYFKENPIKIGLFSFFFSLFFGCYALSVTLTNGIGWLIFPLAISTIAGMVFGFILLVQNISSNNKKGW